MSESPLSGEGEGRGGHHVTSEELGLGCRWPCMGVAHRAPGTRGEPSGMGPTPRNVPALPPWRQVV